MKKVNTVRVKMWGTTVGYLHQEDNGLVGFQYDDEFLKSNIEISPVTMRFTVSKNIISIGPSSSHASASLQY